MYTIVIQNSEANKVSKNIYTLIFAKTHGTSEKDTDQLKRPCLLVTNVAIIEHAALAVSILFTQALDHGFSGIKPKENDLFSEIISYAR
jgi:hypothetical protein